MDEFDPFNYKEPTQEERDYACSVYPEIYPGVFGNVETKTQGDLTITFIDTIWAKEEGSGQVGKYLDSLTGKVVVNWVMSPRLEGMLERRGFVHSPMGKGMHKGL